MSQSYARGRVPGLTLLVAALVASSFPGAAALVPDATSQARAAAGTLTANPGSAIAGEEVELEGKVAATARRKVVLQRQKGSSWVKVDSRTTTKSGRFDFSTRARATTTTYRVQAPAAGGMPATTTRTRTVKTVGQTASLSLAGSAAVGASVSATATFAPARPGRQVQLQRQSGTSWISAATATQSTGGTAVLPVDTSTAGTRVYRVVTAAADGAPAATSSTRSITITGTVVPPPTPTPTPTPTPSPDTTPPGAVAGLSVTSTTTTSITLSWTNPGDGDLSGVMIRRAAGSTPPSSPTSGTLVTQKSGTSHTDSGLSPSTQYAYAVFAYDEVPNYSTGVSTTGTTQEPDTTPPSPVTGLSVTGTTTTSITLSWTNPGDGDLSGVMIRRAPGGTPPSSPTSGTLVIQKSGTSHTDSGLSPGTQYAYAVFAYDEVPNYSTGATTTGTTQTPPPDTTPPGAVTGLSVTGATTTSITLSWTNPGDGDLAGVMIRRAPGSTPPSSPTSGTLVTQKSGTSHTDSGLSPGTQYAYAVFAYDEVPNYSTGATTTGTTSEPPDTTPPGPVTGVGATKTATTVNLTWSNPGAADFAGVVIRRAQGPTAPTTPTGGTAVSSVAAPGTSHTDTGLSPSTQYSYALFAHDEVPNHAAAATVTVTTDAATSQEWAQTGRDAGHTGWSPDERTITPANGASVGEEFSIPGTGSPAIAGGLLYTTGTTPLGPTTLAAYDLATAQQSWQIPTGGTCQGPVAVTATLVIVSCAGTPRAYDRGGSHAVVWDVAETDPGQSVQYHLVLGTTLVAWTNTRVAAYRLSDGQKLWQQLLPSGANSIFDVAAAGSTVVVAYDDRTRALGLTTGSQAWVRLGLRTSSLVIAGDWVYLHDVDEKARQIALATGLDGWTATVPSVVRIVAADADTVYVWEAVYDFSAPSPSILHALRTSDGTQRWQYDVPSRIGSVAVTGDLVWLTSTGIYSQEHASDLIALKRSDGTEVRRLSWDDNMYGWTGVAFGAGKVVIDQGGSFGGPPRFLRVFGLAGPVPVISDRVVPLAYVGSSYSRPLAAQGVGPMSWSIVSGQLPSGMSLSGAGLLSGTPTVAGTTRVRLQVTGGNGRSSRRFLSVQAVQTGTPAWGAYGRDGTRNPFEPSVPTIDADTAPTLAYRWKTAAPGTSTTSYNDPVTVGNRLYEVGVDGVLRAWDTTGSTTNRAPLWNVLPATGSDPATGFTSTPFVDGTRLIVLDQAGFLNARSTVDGAPLWRVASDVSTYPFKGVLVTGTTILGITQTGGVKAYSVTDGSPLWGGTEAAAPSADFYSTSLSTDGTLVYTVTACELYAIRVSNGTTAWHTPISADPAASCGFLNYAAAPVVVGGVVYAATPSGMLSADAATGAPLLRIAVGAYGAQAVVGGVWLFSNYDSDLHGIDAVSGEMLWRYPGVGGFGGLAVSRDLIVVQNGYGGVIGVDRVSGEQVWDGGSSGQVIGTAPAIGSTRFFASQADGVHAFGPL